MAAEMKYQAQHEMIDLCQRERRKGEGGRKVIEVGGHQVEVEVKVT